MIIDVTNSIENRLKKSNIPRFKEKDDSINIRIKNNCLSLSSSDSQSNYSYQKDDHNNNVFNAMDNCFEELNNYKSTKFDANDD